MVEQSTPGDVEPVVERPGRRRVGAALLDTLSAYLPVLLMGLLALGTWWLVKNTPQPDGATAEAAPRHEPDYTMNTFNVQRFAVDGVLRAQIEGDVLRHYPDTDTIEVDHARILNVAPDSVTRAVARLAISNADASEVQLVGGAHVVRQSGTLPWPTAARPLDAPSSPTGADGAVAAAAPPPAADTLDFRGEFLHAFQHAERLRSHLPVVVTRGSTQLRADSMDYDNLDRVLNLKGRVRASFASPAATPPRRLPGAR